MHISTRNPFQSNAIYWKLYGPFIKGKFFLFRQYEKREEAARGFKNRRRIILCALHVLIKMANKYLSEAPYNAPTRR